MVDLGDQTALPAGATLIVAFVADAFYLPLNNFFLLNGLMAANVSPFLAVTQVKRKRFYGQTH